MPCQPQGADVGQAGVEDHSIVERWSYHIRSISRPLACGGGALLRAQGNVPCTPRVTKPMDPGAANWPISDQVFLDTYSCVTGPQPLKVPLPHPIRQPHRMPANPNLAHYETQKCGSGRKGIDATLSPTRAGVVWFIFRGPEGPQGVLTAASSSPVRCVIAGRGIHRRASDRWRRQATFFLSRARVRGYCSTSLCSSSRMHC